MADYRLSAAAVADLKRIYQYSSETFGATQTEADPWDARRIPKDRSKRRRIASGYFRFRYQSHMIFYTIEQDHIVIQRLLYGRMNFAKWI